MAGSRATVQSPAAYDRQNLTAPQIAARLGVGRAPAGRENLRSALYDDSYRLRATAAEVGQGLSASDLVLGYAPGDVRRYGALGDGVADDSAALDKAEAVCFAAGYELVFPAGYVFTYSGSLTLRVSAQGYGAELLQVSGVLDSTNTHGLIVCTSGITLRGLTVDTQFNSTGVAGDGASNVTLIDCTARNCINFGFAFYSGASITARRCRASNVRYSSAPSTGRPADGFYFGACVNSSWESCIAENFRRIGFVSEGKGADKSTGILALACRASDATDCDDSTTEFNAGFWAENTNSVNWVNCIADNIASGVGQTNGRVAGMVALAVGNNAPGVCNVQGCRINGGAGYLPIGIQVTGSGALADVNISGTTVSRARTGINCLARLKGLRVSDVLLDDVVTTQGSHGGIVIDGSAGSNALDSAVIESLSESGCTWVGDSALVNWFSAVAAGGRYVLRNVKGTHIMRSGSGSVRVEGCEIDCGSATYGSFMGSTVEIVNSKISNRAGSNGRIVSPQAGAWVRITGGAIIGPGGGWQNDIGSTGFSLHLSGVRHENFSWRISTQGEFITELSGCSFYGVDGTQGALRANFNAPTRQTLLVRGCYFECSDPSHRPIRKWNSNPQKIVFQGNVYRTAAALHDFAATDSDVNNIGV